VVIPARLEIARQISAGGAPDRQDAAAKRQATELLETFGWPAGRIRDLGGIEAARGAEMYVAFWLRLWGSLGTGHFNVAVARAAG
jgi:hypothetical protein